MIFLLSSGLYSSFILLAIWLYDRSVFLASSIRCVPISGPISSILLFFIRGIRGGFSTIIGTFVFVLYVSSKNSSTSLFMEFVVVVVLFKSF